MHIQISLTHFSNSATESCEGSKWGFLRVPSTSRPFPSGWHVYFTCLHLICLCSFILLDFACKTFLNLLLAWEGKESYNICIDRNCHQKNLFKKSLPDAQELFWLGGGIQYLPPSHKGLKYQRLYIRMRRLFIK